MWRKGVITFTFCHWVHLMASPDEHMVDIDLKVVVMTIYCY